MTKRPRQEFCGRTRREFLWQAGGGFTSLPLLSMLSEDGFLGHQTQAADGASPYENPLAPKPPHFAPKLHSGICKMAPEFHPMVQIFVDFR